MSYPKKFPSKFTFTNIDIATVKLLFTFMEFVLFEQLLKTII